MPPWKKKRSKGAHNSKFISMFFQVPVTQPAVQPEIVSYAFGIPLTNAMLMGVVVLFCIFLTSVWVARAAKPRAGRFQIMLEMFVESVLNLLTSVAGSTAAARMLLPLIGTLFIFLGIGNLIALIPGVTSLTFDGVQVFRTATNDFNMTFSVALAMIIFTNIASISSWGFFGHLGKFFKFKEVVLGFKEGVGAGCLAIVDFLIGLLDIVSEVAKVISLSLRLFGNMFAGDVLAAILLGSFALIIPAPWLAMNLLVGVLQALVFGALTAAYYGLAIKPSEV